MTEADRDHLREIGAIQLTHTALITALFDALERRHRLSPDDINSIFNAAFTGLENAVALGADADLIDRARRSLERTSRNLAGRPRRAAG